MFAGEEKSWPDWDSNPGPLAVTHETTDMLNPRWSSRILLNFKKGDAL